jgi:hypothetical protein
MTEHFLIGTSEGGFVTACRPDVTKYSNVLNMLADMPGKGTPRCSQCEGIVERLLKSCTEDELADADGEGVVADINRLSTDPSPRTVRR